MQLFLSKYKLFWDSSRNRDKSLISKLKFWWNSSILSILLFLQLESNNKFIRLLFPIVANATANLEWIPSN